ncbi:MAG: hypothetical protein AAB466_03910 [Verrucomicrobiota bacterium]
MRMMFFAVLFSMLATPLVLADDRLGPPGKAETAKQPSIAKTNQSSPPVLCYLETRDRIIAIKAGNRYTVKTKTGKLLAENVTLEKLQASYPELHKLVTGGMAKPGARLDASVR